MNDATHDFGDNELSLKFLAEMHPWLFAGCHEYAPIPKGWYGLMVDLCDRLSTLVDKNIERFISFRDIKVKFSRLRICISIDYDGFDAANEDIRNIIDSIKKEIEKTEAAAASTCRECGNSNLANSCSSSCSVCGMSVHGVCNHE